MTINENYIEYKKRFEKKDTRNTVLSVALVFGICAIFLALLLYTWNVLLSLGVFLVLFLIFIFFGVSKDKKEKQKLEEYGASLYREYLKENGFLS